MPIAAPKHLPALLLLAFTFSLAAQTPSAATAPSTATVASASPAATASHRAKAQQLIEMLHTDKIVQQAADNLINQAKEVAGKVSTPNLTSEQKADVDAFEKSAAQTIDQQVGWKVMEPTFIDLYVNTFTEDQLTAIIAFYKTPAGAAFLDKTPVINEQGSQLERTKMAALQTQLRQLFANLQKNLTPTASATPPASSTAPAKSSAPSTAPATSTPK
jgi:hypothetical protein